MALVIKGSSSGQVTVDVPATAGTNTLTLPAVTGTLLTTNNFDLNGQELILDADGDTSIHADTDDQIDFKLGGTDKVEFTAGVITIAGTTTNAMSLEIGSGRTGDGLSLIDLVGDATYGDFGTRLMRNAGANSASELIHRGTGQLAIIAFDAAPITFKVQNTEVARISAAGIYSFGTTDTDPWNNGAGTAGGAAIGASGLTGLGAFARDQGDAIAINYINGTNGNLIAFYHNGSGIGSISHSNGTVSYNAFTGSHPSRFANNSNPVILKGTVMETLDAMCDWYDFNYTGADSEGNDVAKVKEIVLPDGKSAGDSYTMEINGVSRTGTIVAKSNDKHMQCKISDTEDSTRIYGVFSDYLNGDATVYNDMNINAVGTSVIRVASGVTVSAGDLLSSKGDGTAKLQGDDIIRTKTIGKVLSNVKQETYSDGSFTIPAALYCG